MNAIGGKWFKIKQADSDQNRDVVNCHVSLFQSQACLHIMNGKNTCYISLNMIQFETRTARNMRNISHSQMNIKTQTVIF